MRLLRGVYPEELEGLAMTFHRGLIHAWSFWDTTPAPQVLRFGYSNFDIVSNFRFRASDLKAAIFVIPEEANSSIQLSAIEAAYIMVIKSSSGSSRASLRTRMNCSESAPSNTL